MKGSMQQQAYITSCVGSCVWVCTNY